MTERRRLVVIDTDPGIDDLQAISMLVAADQRGELTVVAVTTVAGNVSVKHCTRNARRLLDLLDRLDIPIFAGAHCPLLSEDSRCTNQHYHGKNGLGDVHCDRPLPSTKQRDEHAVSALVRLAREHKGELNIVGLGPLTNLALATRMDPEFVNNINDLYIMGGNKTGVGNISATGEFNFLSDPEAARLTLATARRPVTVCCWEACFNNPIDLQWRRQVLGAADSPLARFFDEIERSSLKDSETWFHGKWVPCDTLAAAAFVRPEVVLKKTEYHAEVETHGVATRGQMVVDRRFWQTAPKHNVSIVEEVDMDLYKRMLLDAFGHPDVKF